MSMTQIKIQIQHLLKLNPAMFLEDNGEKGFKYNIC